MNILLFQFKLRLSKLVFLNALLNDTRSLLILFKVLFLNAIEPMFYFSYKTKTSYGFIFTRILWFTYSYS